jgi:hypothetical protein
MDVTVFACYCPEPHRIEPASPETAELQWIDLGEYDQFVVRSDIADDLKQFRDTPEFAKLVEFSHSVMNTPQLPDRTGK